ncbi:MAG: tetraacyldisaccharide 4'-kinase [Pseudomonadota bacterium]|nr:tetraacyldisaccharide 4'-kinase [Pseudomonadota bacterium]|tara:strand:- start:5629 stop:6639 length:1011 start_codon:yes stop_codon:yes gene_type:complete
MNFLETAWYKKARWLILLWPFSMIYRMVVVLLRKKHQSNNDLQKLSVPVIVIGNISVGGTGKTPLLIALANILKSKGINPGIISRGYGGKAATYPLEVSLETNVTECGDEAILLAEKTGCPIVVAPDRKKALKSLIEKHAVDIVLSDDGMQHYRLSRDLEICVIDGKRLFANGFCFPAGPLREPIKRLTEVDFIVINGKTSEQSGMLQSAAEMIVEPKFLVNLLTEEKRPFSGAPFNMGSVVQAVSAIGNPQRFYDLLDELPYRMKKFSFPDHFLYSEEDFLSMDLDHHQPIVMTEKDAIKCRGFAQSNYWYLLTEVSLPQSFTDDFVTQVESFVQ